MQKDQNNRYLHLLLETFKLFQIKIVLFSLKLFLRTRSDDAWPLIEFTSCEKQKYRVTLVSKDSKHLVGTSGDDSSALIEFTPLWKTRVSNYPLLPKNKKMSRYSCMQKDQNNRYLHLLL